MALKSNHFIPTRQQKKNRGLRPRWMMVLVYPFVMSNISCLCTCVDVVLCAYEGFFGNTVLFLSNFVSLLCNIIIIQIAILSELQQNS